VDIRAISEPLFRAKFWLQLVGVMMIIYGVLVAITIIGIIIAWLPIWMGVLLFQCAGQIERAHAADDAGAMLMARPSSGSGSKRMPVAWSWAIRRAACRNGLGLWRSGIVDTDYRCIWLLD
jgi:hypothetical protein